MKKLFLAILILAASVLPLSTQETQKVVPPEVCIRLIHCSPDGNVCIICIDGYTWLAVGYNAYQMREMKDGKEVLKPCRCEENKL